MGQDKLEADARNTFRFRTSQKKAGKIATFTVGAAAAAEFQMTCGAKGIIIRLGPTCRDGLSTSRRRPP